MPTTLIKSGTVVSAVVGEWNSSNWCINACDGGAEASLRVLMA